MGYCRRTSERIVCEFRSHDSSCCPVPIL